MTALAPAQVKAARNATFALFALAGIMFATWASRIPDAKIKLALTPGELGATLFALSVGSVVALPLTGKVVERFGVVRTVRAGLLMGTMGALLTGLAVDVTASRWLTMGALFLFGMGFASWDVAMNIEGADV